MNSNILHLSTQATDTAAQRDPIDMTANVIEPFPDSCPTLSSDTLDLDARSEQALTPADVWSAICEERVRVHYQPQYDMSTGETVAAEALVRLIDRDGRLIYPDRFIETVEHSDLIGPLGRTVIKQACAAIADCRADGLGLQRLAINLCAHQLNVDTQLPDFVDETLSINGLQPGDLEFELTERQGLDATGDGAAVLRELASRGARIAIDDFGMGYSSIGYLTWTGLPVSSIKLDRVLVNRLLDDNKAQSIVYSLLMLASDLGLEVVAEGIETDEQNQFLASAGCSHAQGFGYARPMSADDLRVFVANNCSNNEGIRGTVYSSSVM